MDGEVEKISEMCSTQVVPETNHGFVLDFCAYVCRFTQVNIVKEFQRRLFVIRFQLSSYLACGFLAQLAMSPFSVSR